MPTSHMKLPGFKVKVLGNPGSLGAPGWGLAQPLLLVVNQWIEGFYFKKMVKNVCYKNITRVCRSTTG